MIDITTSNKIDSRIAELIKDIEPDKFNMVDAMYWATSITRLIGSELGIYDSTELSDIESEVLGSIQHKYGEKAYL